MDVSEVHKIIFPAAKCTLLAEKSRSPWKIRNGYGVVFLSATCLGWFLPIEETFKNVRIKTVTKIK